MKTTAYFLLAVSLIACRKEKTHAFSVREEQNITVHSSALELITKLVAYHQMMISGGSTYNQGSISLKTDTVGTFIHDTVTYTRVPNSLYIHSTVDGFTSAIRPVAGPTNSDISIRLEQSTWNNMQFSGIIHYTVSSPAQVSIQLENVQVAYKGKTTRLEATLQADKSSVNHKYLGFLNGNGDYSFQWTIVQPFVCFGDYKFANINSSPASDPFFWKDGEATYLINGTSIQEKLNTGANTGNKALMIHADGTRKIMVLPLF